MIWLCCGTDFLVCFVVVLVFKSSISWESNCVCMKLWLKLFLFMRMNKRARAVDVAATLKARWAAHQKKSTPKASANLDQATQVAAAWLQRVTEKATKTGGQAGTFRRPRGNTSKGRRLQRMSMPK